MHRIDTATAVDGRFVNKDPYHSIRATKLNAEWFNSVQEEICNLLEDNGVTLDSDNDEQLSSLFGQVLSGVYSAQGHRNKVAISAAGVAVRQNNVDVIALDADSEEIRCQLPDGKLTLIDADGISSEAGLFDSLGVNNVLTLGHNGLSFLPVDSNDPSVAGAVYTGNLSIGSTTSEKNLSVFGSLNVLRAGNFGGMVSMNGGAYFGSVPNLGTDGTTGSAYGRLSKPLVFLNGTIDTDIFMQQGVYDSLGVVRVFVNHTNGTHYVIIRKLNDQQEMIEIEPNASVVIVCVGINASNFRQYAKVV